MTETSTTQHTTSTSPGHLTATVSHTWEEWQGNWPSAHYRNDRWKLLKTTLDQTARVPPDSHRLDLTFCPTWGGWWERRHPARCTGCPPPGRQCPERGSCPPAMMLSSGWCSLSLQMLSQGTLPQKGGICCETSARKAVLVSGQPCEEGSMRKLAS